MNRNVASQADGAVDEVLRFVFGRVEGKPQKGGKWNQADGEPAQKNGFGHELCVQEIKETLYPVVFQTSANQAIIRFI